MSCVILIILAVTPYAGVAGSTVTAEMATCKAFVERRWMMSIAAVRATAEPVRLTEGTAQSDMKAVSVVVKVPDQDGDHW